MNNIGLLILIFIVKIVILISLPLYYYLFKEKNYKVLKGLIVLNILLLISYIPLSIFNVNYFANSNFIGIKNAFNSLKYTNDTIEISENPNIVEKFVTNKIYKTNTNNNIYYFNNSELPLSGKRILCDTKEIYLKQYGSNITAMSIIASSIKNKNIDPIEILNNTKNANLFDCNSGVNTDQMLDYFSHVYIYNYRQIDSFELENNILNGKIVLAEIDSKGNDPISCGVSYIVIYNIDKNGNYHILNPIDRDYDYICPDSSNGFGKVIKANTNERSYSLDELNQISIRYIAIERN